MDNRLDRVAAVANVAAYDAVATRAYVDGAPHIKHVSLRRLYGRLVIEVFEEAKRRAPAPRVLDLGAGEGSVTLPFLELGAEVVAVDVAESQLEALRRRCSAFGSALQTRLEDFAETLRRTEDSYDVVVANSFLHHVPDYLGLIREAAGRLRDGGQFFSFQDPLRYDSLPRPARVFSSVAYLSWRICKGDVIGGLRRRLRRSRGVYLQDSVHDNAEYHVTRNGVDQEAVKALLESLGFETRVIRYFSTQSRLFQPAGRALGVENTFAVVARRNASCGRV